MADMTLDLLVEALGPDLGRLVAGSYRLARTLAEEKAQHASQPAPAQSDPEGGETP